MSKTRKWLITGGAVLALAAGGVGASLATGAVGGSSDDDPGTEAPGDGDASVTGSGADQATAAALKITGGGHANAVERDSENGATWEVEVTKPDGKTVDVRLDQSYKLVVVEDDSGG